MRFRAALLVGAILTIGRAALAAPPGADVIPPPAPKDIREEAPLIGYTTSAFGASRFTAGAAGYAGVLGGAPATTMPSTTQLAAGARIWGSPIDRLTLFVAVDRRFYDKAAPSATAMVRIVGGRREGWALSAFATYRADGFAELAGEIEGALAFSIASRGLHADANLVFGGGLEEEEADGELHLRVGYDVTQWLRVGADGQFRLRVAGNELLPGGRVADAVAGPEVLFGLWHFFVAASGGPTTVGVARGVGWTARTTLGGAYF